MQRKQSAKALQHMSYPVLGMYVCAMLKEHGHMTIKTSNLKKGDSILNNEEQSNNNEKYSSKREDREKKKSRDREKNDVSRKREEKKEK